MKNSLGSSVILTLFGESHQECVGAVLDGLTPGIAVDEEFIKKMLEKRKAKTSLDTPRREADNFKIVSGVFNGFSTGSPITIIIPNENTHSGDYDKNLIRPSHADYVSQIKYHGFADYRGGGHFSGRLTAPIVAAGAIVLKALQEKGIHIGTHILKCGSFIDNVFQDYEKEIETLNGNDKNIIKDDTGLLDEEILKAKKNLDSIGGILQTAIIGLPAGVGEPWFSSLEGLLANAMFSLGGVKGIEFGKGFGFADGYGSELNDAFIIEDDVVKTKTNNNGGINGGISNGMPVVFNLAVKPTPSIGIEQDSIDLENHQNTKIKIIGRHDPAIIRRLPVVVTCLTAIVLADELEKKYGVDYFKK